MIGVTTLGRVSVNGRRTRRIRSIEVVTLLAFHDGWALRDAMQAALFGEGAARSSLASLVSRTRQLGFTVVEEDGGYRLVSRVELDVLRVDQLLSQGRVAEALEHYRGPFLPGARSPFAEEVRAYLEESLVQAVLAGRNPQWIAEALGRVGPEPRLVEALEELRASGVIVPVARAQLAGAGLK
ncbi:AfsR/SARP family transcriptional regulator [Marinithermus hydrothermalis]|uniref:Uncharacterized protein n=1 Tax=Marinithermus hydrothermalis (strain DSM 14884 / JCM 11576 / T1) TaxID=869210 RepID=F2NPP9_MARHT|nr:hypothetical protein [Marinithermus hydrothermalis]AEB12825.1 hypothetical protein Marky_2100 [Marinithermus hydrothermalis DSM 14884]